MSSRLVPPATGEPSSLLLAQILAACSDGQNQPAYQKVLRGSPDGLTQMALAANQRRKSHGLTFRTPLEAIDVFSQEHF